MESFEVQVIGIEAKRDTIPEHDGTSLIRFKPGDVHYCLRLELPWGEQVLVEVGRPVYERCAGKLLEMG